jgi:hypothetical protein
MPVVSTKLSVIRNEHRVRLNRARRSGRQPSIQRIELITRFRRDGAPSMLVGVMDSGVGGAVHLLVFDEATTACGHRELRPTLSNETSERLSASRFSAWCGRPLARLADTRNLPTDQRDDARPVNWPALAKSPA